VVQIVINNHDTGSHPFHLHGHTFWVMGFGMTNGTDYNPSKNRLVRNGVRRDTIKVEAGSWTVIRFVANNPGVWLFHCHINWHLESGLAATIIEARNKIRRKIPEFTRRICSADGVTV